jgi:pimeloyl-ACP methyl ester carboxylesterase
LSVDLPGHGLTGPDPGRDYTAKRFAVVLDRVLDDARIDRATLVGNSMGGWVAWQYARLRPRRVAKLVLVDAYGAPNQAPIELPLAFKVARWPVMRHALLRITPRFAVADGLRQSSFDSSWINNSQIDRHWLLLRRAGNRRAMLDQFQVLQPNARASDISGIDAPTLVLWGAEDRLIPFQNGLWFAAHIKNSELHVLDRVGHLPMQESPRRFSSLLRVWHSTH